MGEAPIRDLNSLVAAMGATDLDDAARRLTEYVGREPISIRPAPVDPEGHAQFYIEGLIYRALEYPFSLNDLWAEMDALRQAMEFSDRKVAEYARARRIRAYNATYPVLGDAAGLHIWPPSAARDDDNLDAQVPEWVLLERNPGLDYAASGLPEPDKTAIVERLESLGIEFLVGEAVSHVIRSPGSAEREQVHLTVFAFDCSSEIAFDLSRSLGHEAILRLDGTFQETVDVDTGKYCARSSEYDPINRIWYDDEVDDDEVDDDEVDDDEEVVREQLASWSRFQDAFSTDEVGRGWLTEAAAGAQVIMATTDWAVANSRGWAPSAGDVHNLTNAVLSPIASHAEATLHAEHGVSEKEEEGRARLLLGFIGALALSNFDPSAPVIEWAVPALIEDWVAHHAARGLLGRRTRAASDTARTTLTEIASEWASPSLARAVPPGTPWAEGFRESLAGRLAALVDWWQRAAGAAPNSDAGRFLLRQCTETWLATIGRVDPEGVREVAQHHQRDVLQAVRDRQRIDDHLPPGRPDQRITLPFAAGEAEPNDAPATPYDPSDGDPSDTLSPATVMVLQEMRNEIDEMLRQPEPVLGPLPTYAQHLLGVVLRTIDATGRNARLAQGAFTWAFTATLTAIGAEDTVEDGVVDEKTFVDACTALRRSLVPHLDLESTLLGFAGMHVSAANAMEIQDLDAAFAQVLLVAGTGITAAAVWADQVKIDGSMDQRDLDPEDRQASPESDLFVSSWLPPHTSAALAGPVEYELLLNTLELGGPLAFRMAQITTGDPTDPPALLVEGFAYTIRPTLEDRHLDDVDPAFFDLLLLAFQEGWRLGRWALNEFPMVDPDDYDDVEEEVVLELSTIAGSLTLDRLQTLRAGQVMETLTSIAAACQEAEDPGWLPDGGDTVMYFVAGTIGVGLAVGAHAVLEAT